MSKAMRATQDLDLSIIDRPGCTCESMCTCPKGDAQPAMQGERPYKWDIVSDSLIWGECVDTLPSGDLFEAISTNREFNELLLPNANTTRDKKVLTSRQKDTGNGVEYRLQYSLPLHTASSSTSSCANIWIEDIGRWFADKDGNPVRAEGILYLYTERRDNEERLNRLSRHDFLTGLYNRNHLNFCLENTFSELKRTNGTAGFMVIGLEHFDLINSVYGYEAGDAVIAEVAGRLRKNLRENDIIGRFSGAKIGIILHDCDDRDILIAGYRILNLLRENVVVTNRGSIAISISIGGVIIPKQAGTAREVYVAAQQALTESRRARDCAIVSYRHDPVAEEQKRQDAKTAERIITALKDGHIYLAFQPIVDAATHELKYHEALVRMQHPGGEPLIAEDFVGIAEKLGLIRLVDHHALDLALEILVAAPTAKFSLNVSNETASDPEWLSKLAVGVHDDATIAERLIIEITESHAAESMSEALQFIDAVHDLGCKVALDDFGAGFTSFRNLKSLPFDIIKIDGQFVDNLSSNHVNQSFIRALVDLARLFKAETIVEWIEDEETARLLNSWGVNALQGYAFGKPQRELPWPTCDDDKNSNVA